MCVGIDINCLYFSCINVCLLEYPISGQLTFLSVLKNTYIGEKQMHSLLSEIRLALAVELS